MFQKIKFAGLPLISILQCLFFIVITYNYGPGHIQAANTPECWDLSEKITYTGRHMLDPQVEQRVSTYEIRDDDTVTPNHELSGLGYYSSFTWEGTTDVEWLVLEGNFSYYEINSELHQVTFYGLQDWLHIVYRTHNFVQRSPDQIHFCVTGQNGNWSRPTQVRVLYPANYDVQSVTPAGYTIPASGEIRWDFGSILEFQVDTVFAGLGPDRPLLDLPVDYHLRETTNSSISDFQNAFNHRATSKFDHEYPYLTNPNFNCTSNPLSGIQHDNMLTDWTGEPKGPPGNVCNTTLRVSSYDGHDAYDFDDICPRQDPGCNRTAVYAAAEGDIVESQTGWNNVYGCRVTINHSGGWVTVYAHLFAPSPSGQNRCVGENGIRPSGHVTRLDQIGTIGATGSGSAGTTHLHFIVKHNGIAVDPSGWEPNPQARPDPWALHSNGTESYPMWRFSLRTTLAFDPDSGGQMASPSHEINVAVPAGFYDEQLVFNLSSYPVNGLFGTLVNTGQSYSLTAVDLAGNSVHQMNEYLTLQINFTEDDLAGIEAESLSLYTWNQTTNEWEAVPTTINWEGLIATAEINHLSIFALMGRTENILFLPVVLGE